MNKKVINSHLLTRPGKILNYFVQTINVQDDFKMGLSVKEGGVATNLKKYIKG